MQRSNNNLDSWEVACLAANWCGYVVLVISKGSPYSEVLCCQIFQITDTVTWTYRTFSAVKAWSDLIRILLPSATYQLVSIRIRSLVLGSTFRIALWLLCNMYSLRILSHDCSFSAQRRTSLVSRDEQEPGMKTCLAWKFAWSQRSKIHFQWATAFND